VTPPLESKVEPDWDQSLASMVENQPDVARARARVKTAEDLRSVGVKSKSEDDLNEKIVEKKSSLKQLISEQAHSLARFFLEIDANYKQFQTAARLRAASAKRLDSQLAYYEEGRITIDRLLDSVSQYTAAVGTEFQYRSTYNISIVAFEEAKGTLLEYDKITVVPKLKAVSESPAATEPGVVQAVATVPPPVAVAEPKADRLKREPEGKTVSFDFTVGVGAVPVQVRGSFTVEARVKP
jgi:hypothetical protein